MSQAVGEVKSAPHVVVAIVATDEVKNILGCLSCLAESTYREFSVVICENAGPEAFARDVREAEEKLDVSEAPETEGFSFKRADCRRFHFCYDKRLVTILGAPENRGYSGGVNACIAVAGAGWDFVWVLNPDTFPEADALGALVRRQAAAGYGIVGSRLVFVSSGRVQLWGGLKYWSLLGRCRSLGFNQPLEATPNVEEVEAQLDIISGASMLVSKDYIESVGVMDEDFFVYYEDVEWSLRRGRFRLGYAHDSVVRHLAGATSGSGGPRPKRSKFSVYLGERNRVMIARKRFSSAWPLFTLFAMLQTTEHLVRFRSWRSFKIAIAGWWAGIRGETGMPRFMRGSEGPAVKAFLRRSD